MVTNFVVEVALVVVDLKVMLVAMEIKAWSNAKFAINQVIKHAIIIIITQLSSMVVMELLGSSVVMELLKFL